MSGKKGIIRPGSKDILFRKPDTNNSGSSQININEAELDSASRSIADRRSMNEDVMVLVPELKQAENVIVSSIISPNDYSKKELLSDYDNFLGLPEDIVSDIRGIIETNILRYKLTDELDNVVRTCLFDDGAYPELILPRSKISEIITSDADLKLKSKTDLESFTIDSYSTKLENMGYVNVKTDTKVMIDSEEFQLSNLGVSTISNPAVLLIPEIYDESRQKIMARDLYLSSERVKDIESIDSDVLSVYDNYKRRKKERYISITRDTKIKTDDVPFRLKVSSRAILPIYTDDEKKHLGYFLLADEMNRPITRKVEDDELYNLYKSNNDGNVLKGVLNNASKNLDKSNDASVIISNMVDVAGRILMSSIDEAVSNSIYRNSHTSDYENSLLKIMLARALEEKQTKLIFIPAEYVSYIAFDYRKNGTGKTIIEDITLLASFKAMLLISQIYASTTSNIPINDVVVDIDEKDPEPMKTKQMLEEIILNGGRKRLAWGETSIERFGDWIQNSGTRITWNHKTFPDTKITMDKKNTEVSYTPNTEVMDNISAYMLRHMGLTPSILDDASQSEFASVAMINNALSNKINNERQDILNAGESDKLRKLIRADNQSFDEVKALVTTNKAKILSAINSDLEDGKKLEDLSDGLIIQIALDIIEGMRVRVPRAESKDKDDLREKFLKYKETVGEVVDSMTASSYLEDVVSELGITKENIINNIKLIALVDWCEEHNYARGLVRLIDMTDKADLKALISRISDKDENLILLASEVSKVKTKVLEKIKPEEPPVDNPDGGDNNLDGDGNPIEPTEAPIDEELVEPGEKPSEAPIDEELVEPTEEPTEESTEEPTEEPTESPEE
jgi:hypothetical protein